MPSPDLHARLANWAAAQRWHARYAQAHSLEGSYRSPQPWDAPAPLPPDSPVDHSDAREIELAVCSLDLFDHLVLKAHWIMRWPPPRVLRAARQAGGLRRFADGSADHALALALECAETALIGALGVPAVTRRLRVARRIREALGGPSLAFADV